MELRIAQSLLLVTGRKTSEVEMNTAHKVIDHRVQHIVGNAMLLWTDILLEVFVVMHDIWIVSVGIFFDKWPPIAHTDFAQ